jgi:hypothetical protein
MKSMPERGRLGFCLALLPISLFSLAAAPPDYLDAKVCGECHSRIAEAYERIGMARSFGRLRTGTPTVNAANMATVRRKRRFSVFTLAPC